MTYIEYVCVHEQQAFPISIGTLLNVIVATLSMSTTSRVCIFKFSVNLSKYQGVPG